MVSGCLKRIDTEYLMRNLDASVRAAIHAPTSKDWSENSGYVFAGTEDGSDPSTFYGLLGTHSRDS